MILQRHQRHQRHHRRPADRLGFTLMEVLVVMAILVILAGTASIFLFKYLEDSKMNRAQADMQTLTKACQAYKLKHDEYPPNLEELLHPQNESKPYLDSADAILDPWGKPYTYDASGRNNSGMKPDISTTSSDGEPISNWERVRQR